jgi:glycosyltransferase involved in cell wall biosynthesis
MAIRIVNIITRMIVGGPQQVSLLAADYYRGSRGFEYHLVYGDESGAEGDYHADIVARGLRAHALPTMVREVSPRRDPRGLYDLVRLLRRLRPHVVHARSAKARLLGPLAARLAGVPVIVQTVHGWSFNNAVDARRPLFVQLERLAARACHATVFVSRQDFDEGVALGIVRADALETGRSAIVRSGIDLSTVRRSSEEERRRLRASLGVDDDRPILGLVQRLSEPKTPLVFVEAVRALAADHPRAAVWIVGDGQLREPTERAVDEAGLRSRVQFLGVRRDVPAILSALDVAVHSSIREGLPRVVLESLCVGTPLVATEVGGVGEVVRHGVTGLLVPASNPAALTAALRAVLGDPAAAAARAARGLEAVYPFSAQRMLDDQHALYTRLLRARGVAVPDSVSP